MDGTRTGRGQLLRRHAVRDGLRPPAHGPRGVRGKLTNKFKEKKKGTFTVAFGFWRFWKYPHYPPKLHYPKIPGRRNAGAGRCIAFEKYDGTNLHWEWDRDFGWHSFGPRQAGFNLTGEGVELFRRGHAHLRQAVPVFRAEPTFAWVGSKRAATGGRGRIASTVLPYQILAA